MTEEQIESAPLILSDGERRGVERGLEDVRNSRFASDDDVRALFSRYKS